MTDEDIMALGCIGTVFMLVVVGGLGHIAAWGIWVWTGHPWPVQPNTPLYAEFTRWCIWGIAISIGLAITGWMVYCFVAYAIEKANKCPSEAREDNETTKTNSLIMGFMREMWDGIREFFRGSW